MTATTPTARAEEPQSEAARLATAASAPRMRGAVRVGLALPYVLALLASVVAAESSVPSGSGVVTNTSAIFGKIPLKALRLLVPQTPVYGGSKASVTLVFSRSVIRLGSNFGPEIKAHAETAGVQPLLWSCNGGSPKFPGAPPIAGRTWWVTTSILRFDPSEPGATICAASFVPTRC